MALYVEPSPTDQTFVAGVLTALDAIDPPHVHTTVTTDLVGNPLPPPFQVVRTRRSQSDWWFCCSYASYRAGSNLLWHLVDGSRFDRTVTIRQSNSNWTLKGKGNPNVATDYQYVVEWNPADNTLGATNGDWCGSLVRPAYIGLAHELIHSLDFSLGHFFGPGSRYIPDSVCRENQIRAEQGICARRFYAGHDTWCCNFWPLDVSDRHCTVGPAGGPSRFHICIIVGFLVRMLRAVPRLVRLILSLLFPRRADPPPPYDPEDYEGLVPDEDAVLSHSVRLGLITRARVRRRIDLSHVDDVFESSQQAVQIEATTFEGEFHVVLLARTSADIVLITDLRADRQRSLVDTPRTLRRWRLPLSDSDERVSRLLSDERGRREEAVDSTYGREHVHLVKTESGIDQKRSALVGFRFGLPSNPTITRDPPVWHFVSEVYETAVGLMAERGPGEIVAIEERRP